MMYRVYKEKPTAESWHRDEAPNSLKNDKIFGGWWNLDSKDQYFSCVPGTHKVVDTHSGFNQITTEESESYKEKKEKIVVPPGHIIIFYEKIVHEVFGKSSPKDGIVKLFLGWRLTNSKKSLIDQKLEQPVLKDYLKTQAVIPLKSGQIPHLYTNYHWTRFRSKIEQFSEKFKHVCKENKKVKSGKEKDKSFLVIHQEMKSLEEYNLEKYPDYSEDEIKMHYPNKRWTILKPNSTSEYSVVEF